MVGTNITQPNGREKDMGDGFAVSTESLRYGADVHLGHLIDDIRAMQGKIAASEQAGTPFAGPGDIFSGIAPFWDDTLYYLHRVLDDNIENLELDQKALRAIADRYDENEDATTRAVRSW